MEDHRKIDMLATIEKKLGFNLKEYEMESRRSLQESLKKMKETGECDCHECDNIPNPFEKLTLEELKFVREYLREAK